MDRSLSPSLSTFGSTLGPHGNSAPTPPGRVGKVRAKQRGAGHLKAIIWTLILISGVYVAFKVVPLLINEYQFQDGLQTIARFASVNRDPNDKILAAILKEAEKDDVPVEAQDVKVEGKGGNIKINVDYSVTADLSVYQWTLNFHPKVSNDSLL
jgi:hypothetical protein